MNTDTREEVLSLIDSGFSYSEAGARLGLTKGQVAGILWRKNNVRPVSVRPVRAQPAVRRPARDTSKCGFASMSAEKQRAIASMGGKAVPNEKRSFSRNRDLASQAGRKGGQNVSDENRSFTRDRDLAVTAGRKGGQASHGGRPRAVESVA